MKKSKREIALSVISTVVMVSILISGCSSKKSRRNDDDDDDLEDEIEEVEEGDSSDDAIPWLANESDTQSGYYDDDSDYDPHYDTTYETTRQTAPAQTQSAAALQDASTQLTDIFKKYKYSSFVNTMRLAGIDFTITGAYGPGLTNLQSGDENMYAVQSIECVSVNPLCLNVYCTYDFYDLKLSEACAILDYYGIKNYGYGKDFVFDNQGHFTCDLIIAPSLYNVKEIYVNPANGMIYLEGTPNGQVIPDAVWSIAGDYIKNWLAGTDERAARRAAREQEHRQELERWVDGFINP